MSTVNKTKRKSKPSKVSLVTVVVQGDLPDIAAFNEELRKRGFFTQAGGFHCEKVSCEKHGDEYQGMFEVLVGEYHKGLQS